MITSEGHKQRNMTSTGRNRFGIEHLNKVKSPTESIHSIELTNNLRVKAKGELGFINSSAAFDTLNEILRAEDPGAFENDLVQLHRRK